MIKDRAWRRYIEYTKVIKRLKNIRRGYYFHDINRIRIEIPIWSDYIGTDVAFSFKTMTTDRWQTRYKSKWGKVKNNKWGDYSDHFTRVKDKDRFRKQLDELGYKHLPNIILT